MQPQPIRLRCMPTAARPLTAAAAKSTPRLPRHMLCWLREQVPSTTKGQYLIPVLGRPYKRMGQRPITAVSLQPLTVRAWPRTGQHLQEAKLSTAALSMPVGLMAKAWLLFHPPLKQKLPMRQTAQLTSAEAMVSVCWQMVRKLKLSIWEQSMSPQPPLLLSVWRLLTAVRSKMAEQSIWPLVRQERAFMSETVQNSIIMHRVKLYLPAAIHIPEQSAETRLPELSIFAKTVQTPAPTSALFTWKPVHS